MPEDSKSQATEALKVYIRMRQLGVRQFQLKKRLRRSHTSISLALSGRGHQKLLGRISKYLDRIERRRKGKRSTDSAPHTEAA